MTHDLDRPERVLESLSGVTQPEKYEKQITSLKHDLEFQIKKNEMQLSALKENLATVRTELRAVNVKLAELEHKINSCSCVTVSILDTDACLAVSQEERRVLLERSLSNESKNEKLIAENAQLIKKNSNSEAALQEMAREFQSQQGVEVSEDGVEAEMNRTSLCYPNGHLHEHPYPGDSINNVSQTVEDLNDEIKRLWPAINTYNRDMDVNGSDENIMVLNGHVEWIKLTRSKLEAVVNKKMEESKATEEFIKQLREEKIRSAEYEQYYEEKLNNCKKKVKELEKMDEELDEMLLTLDDFYLDLVEETEYGKLIRWEDNLEILNASDGD
ncbi:unnamed protein product [Adineta steineri]|uniref:Uncharacterized protein n=1 Tax=Adineta steineri TaxID=433720 RepID=A0A814KQ56_9BILA|nr:unnamed protein product [Adineta steineri]CAF3804130.1 unnamed protein product [Adineta steineri]